MRAHSLVAVGPTSTFERLADKWRLAPVPVRGLSVDDSLKSPVTLVATLLLVSLMGSAVLASSTRDNFDWLALIFVVIAAGSLFTCIANLRQKAFARTFLALTTLSKVTFVSFVLLALLVTALGVVLGAYASFLEGEDRIPAFTLWSLGGLSLVLTTGYLVAMPPAVSLDWRGSRSPRLIALVASGLQGVAVLVLLAFYTSSSPVAAIAGLPVALGLAGITAAAGVNNRSRKQREELADLFAKPERLFSQALEDEKIWTEIETSLLSHKYAVYATSVDVFIRDALFVLRDRLVQNDRTLVSWPAERHFSAVLGDETPSAIAALFEDGCLFIRGRLLRSEPRLRDLSLSVSGTARS
jgi:hypothetical protein